VLRINGQIKNFCGTWQIIYVQDYEFESASCRVSDCEEKRQSALYFLLVPRTIQSTTTTTSSFLHHGLRPLPVLPPRNHPEVPNPLPPPIRPLLLQAELRIHLPPNYTPLLTHSFFHFPSTTPMGKSRPHLPPRRERIYPRV